jgi:hypothetical protein
VYGCGLLLPTLQLSPPTPEGPAVALANTVTAWFAQTLPLASFDVLSDTVTGSSSTCSVSEDDVITLAAFIALIVTGSEPSPGT